jgi:uncharacterized membrane protein YgcG
MKKVAALVILVILMLTTSALAISEIPSPTSRFYVNDFADIFTDQEEKMMFDKAVKFAKDYDGIQVVVTSIFSLEGEDVASYAKRMYNEYKIGRDDMGILILISINDRKFRIHAGLKMKNYVTSSIAELLITEVTPILRENKFSEGIIQLQDLSFKKILSTVYPSPQVQITTPPAKQENAVPEQKTEKASSSDGYYKTLLIILSCCALIIIILLLITLYNKNKEIISLNGQLKESNNQKNSLSESLYAKLNEANGENDALINKNNTLQTSLNTQKARYERACRISPDLDRLVTEDIEKEKDEKDMKAASKVDEIISKVIDLKPCKDNVDKAHYALEEYSKLTKNQKAYVKSDIKKLQSLYDDSLRLKHKYDEEQQEIKYRQEAHRAYTFISPIVLNVYHADRHDLARLESAHREYTSLSSGAQAHFDTSITSRLESLLHQAKSDQSNYQETLQAHDTSSSSTDCSGFGGSAGDDGASGNF